VDYRKSVGQTLTRVYAGAIAFVCVFVAMNIALPLSLRDTLVALLILFGPWSAGSLLGRSWGGTWFGLTATLMVGVVTIGAALLAFLFLAGSSQEAACGEDECLHYLGHWIEWTVAIEWPIYALIAWTFSAIVFASRTRGRQPNP